MSVRRTVTGGRVGPQPSRQVVLRGGEARVVLALLDVRGVDRLWTLTSRGIPVRVDAGLEWENRTATSGLAARSVRLPAGGIDMVVHDNRRAGPTDLDAALGTDGAVAAVVFVDDHHVDVVDPACARDRAAGTRDNDGRRTRQRLTRTIFGLAAGCVDDGTDVRTVLCGPAVWDLLASEAAHDEPAAVCYDEPVMLRGQYPFVRDANLAEDEVHFAGPHTLSGYRYAGMWLPVTRALAVGAPTDVMADPETVTRYSQLRSGGIGPGEAAATAGAADASWKRRRAARLGIDVDNPAELVAFANIGLTVAVWRNTSLEDVHCGWRDEQAEPVKRPEPTTNRADDARRTRMIAAHLDAGGGIPDDTMLRLNTWTQHQLAGYITAQTVDLAAVRALLCEPDRMLHVAEAQLRASEFFGGQLTDLTTSIAEQCHRLAQHAHREGDQALVYALAISGYSYAPDWWGTPYWPDIVNRLPPNLPDPPARQLLIHTPWLLTSGHTDQIVWTEPFEDAKTDAKRAWSADRDCAQPALSEALVL